MVLRGKRLGVSLSNACLWFIHIKGMPDSVNKGMDIDKMEVLVEDYPVLVESLSSEEIFLLMKSSKDNYRGTFLTREKDSH